MNQWCCLEESGQWLENIDQTHLVLKNLSQANTQSCMKQKNKQTNSSPTKLLAKLLSSTNYHFDNYFLPIFSACLSLPLLQRHKLIMKLGTLVNISCQMKNFFTIYVCKFSFLILALILKTSLVKYSV